MKWLLDSFLICASVQLFAGEKDSLKEACGYVCLSSEQIESLNDWNKPKKASIGSDGMTMIVEKDSKASINERQVRSIGARK
jgi:hypothetical protein